MSRLFKDDLSRLALLVGPLEVHVPEVVDVLGGSLGMWVVGEDVLERADALEGPVVKLVLRLDAGDERRRGYALAGRLRDLFPVDAVEYLLKNCARPWISRRQWWQKLRWQKPIRVTEGNLALTV